MVYIENMKRLKIQQMPTEHGNYNAYGTYTGFGPFTYQLITRKLHNLLSVIPKKALMVTYLPDHDPLENYENESFSKYAFLDFIWMVEDSPSRRILERGTELRIALSRTEDWLITLQDPDVNLLRDSYASTTVYFSETEDCSALANEMPFNGCDYNPPQHVYHNDVVVVCSPSSIIGTPNYPNLY